MTAPAAPPNAPGHAETAHVVRVLGRVQTELAAELGALPGFALGPSLAGVLGLDSVRLRLAATYFAPRFADGTAPGQSPRGADVSLLVAGISGCYAFTPTAAELAACAELEAGALFAAGTGFDQSNDATTPWVAAGGSVELDVRVAGPLSLRASVGALAPFGRSPVRFKENTGDVVDIHTIHHPWAVSGRAALGVGLSFW
jgi:hypothetical protein